MPGKDQTTRRHTPRPAAAVRIDKWLWAARFFKTRALAIEAINGGKVHLNGSRVKPARKLAVGDRLTVRKGVYLFEFRVTGLSLQRGPAEMARTLYEETEASIAARQALREEHALQGKPARHQRRPDKRARRQIHRFKTEQS